MLRINCPFCGPRDMTEFTYIGDANVHRPDGDGSEKAFYTYVYLRDNPRGVHGEIWQHTGGCRGFVKVIRDTLTHEILATAHADEEIKL